ncbi:MFS transporter [Nocardioides sp.]|uniref:MFS transporter n=1 Tax=Nocardioides sp. TaxID=35761 RepID=UPI001A25B2F3|nr:MFS transporter [Nocardioides sp.]MBJ7359061.1 MFS transporter [Nocardioides sp.]
MAALVAVSLSGFSGYAALLAVAPAWAVEGGANEAGAGLVNGVLLAATVATQLFVPRLLRRYGTTPVLVAGLVLMGVAAPAYAVSDALGPVLAWSAVRGMGFGIVTVLGSTIVTHLVPRERRGEAIGVYGLAVAAPMVLLMPASVAVADRFGYGWVFAVAALPLVGVPAALALGRRVDRTASASVTDEDEAHLTDVGTVRAVLRPTVLLFVVTMAGGAVMTFAPQLGFGGLWAAAALLVLGSSTALARWLVGSVADRRGAEGFVVPLLLLCAVGVGLCVLAVRTDQAWLLVAGGLALGVPYGALQNLTLLIAFARVPASGIPTASAVWNIGFDAGTATGAVVVGSVAAASSFGTAFGLVLLLLLVMPAVAPRRPAAAL